MAKKFSCTWKLFCNFNCCFVTTGSRFVTSIVAMLELVQASTWRSLGRHWELPKFSPGGVQELQVEPRRRPKGTQEAPNCMQEAPQSAKLCSKAPKRCQVAPKRRPRGSKLHPRGSKWDPRGSKLAPSWLQEAPKRLQVGSKRRPRGSKLSGKGLQGALGEHQGGFRTPFEGQNVKTSIFNDSTTLFHGFCCIRRPLGRPKWSPSCAWRPV